MPSNKKITAKKTSRKRGDGDGHHPVKGEIVIGGKWGAGHAFSG